MRLFRLELKRLFHTKSFFFLWLISLILSALFAWLPTTYAYSQYVDETGKEVTLRGLASLEYEKKQQKAVEGPVLIEKVKQAVLAYQDCLKKYGVSQSYDLPEGVYEQEIMPISPLLHGVKELFAHPQTGMAPSLLEIDAERLDFYYSLCENRVATILEMEMPHQPQAKNQALALYEQVKKPFELQPGMNSSVLDYQNLLGFLLLLFCIAFIAPTFSLNYQIKADGVFRATKYGKKSLAIVKSGAAFLVCSFLFLSCMALYLVLVNFFFGWQSTQTSIQMVYSIATLANLNILELQIVLASCSLLALLACLGMTLFLSATCKNTLVCLVLSLLLALAPTIISMTLSEELSLWCCTFLPASITSIQASLLYAITDFHFLAFNGFVLWSPFGMVITCLLEIPLFIFFTIYSYCHHQE